MDRTSISRNTTLCISLAGRPSSIGTRFHNYLYGQLGLDYVYKACTTTDLPAAIAGIRALGIRGCGVSMPFKESVIALVDELEPSARAIDSVNTIVNTGGVLRAYNTDYLAISELLVSHGVPANLPVTVLGSGGMAKAVVAALRDLGFADVVVLARNRQAGPALAAAYGYPWQPELAGRDPGVLVNATPIGMAGGADSDSLPVPEAVVTASALVFDVVAVPAQTPLLRAASAAAVPVITGGQVIALQAAHQFQLYTGVLPTPEQLAAAAEFSQET